MILKIYTDGGSLHNPGEAAIAYVIYKDDLLLAEHGERIGVATNNDAEYQALIAALQKVIDLKKDEEIKEIERISCISDSQLMVSQLNGLYKVKHGPIREYIFKIRSLEGDINLPISYTHVLRQKNKRADSLVKKALGR